MSSKGEKDPREYASPLQRLPKEQLKSQGKDRKDCFNPVKPKQTLSEMSHLGAINSLLPARSGLPTPQLAPKNLIPEGPHKAIHRAAAPVKAPPRPPSLPPSDKLKGALNEVSTNVRAPTAASGEVPKKNLSIKIPEASPKGNAVRVTQFKSLSTRHSNMDAMTAEQQSKTPGLQPSCTIIIPNHDPAKCSLKRNGVVRAYAANTNQGLVR